MGRRGCEEGERRVGEREGESGGGGCEAGQSAVAGGAGKVRWGGGGGGGSGKRKGGGGGVELLGEGNVRGGGCGTVGRGKTLLAFCILTKQSIYTSNFSSYSHSPPFPILLSPPVFLPRLVPLFPPPFHYPSAFSSPHPLLQVPPVSY